MIEPTDTDRNGGSRRIAETVIGLFFAIVVVGAAIIFGMAWRNRPVELSTSTLHPIRQTDPPAGHAVKPREVVPLIPIPEIERRILAALEKPFPATAQGAEKLTLREAVARIAKLLPVPVDFDSKSLEDASIDLGIEVELPHGSRTIGSVLDSLLALPPQSLTWVVHNEALLITTVEKADQMRDTRVYEVTDLADRAVTPDGVKWSDAARLAAVVRKSFLVDEDTSLFDAVNVDERALIVANLSRQSHQELAAALTSIRRTIENGGPVPSFTGPRRVEQKPRGKAPSPPIKATKSELASLGYLSKSPPADLSPAVVSSANAFACDLYRQLRREGDASLVVSPFGLYFSLAMLKEGASGTTDRQMDHVLHATSPTNELRQSMRLLSDRLSAIHLIPGYELVMRNKAWCEESLPIPQSIKDLLHDDYHAETIGVPFFKRPAEATTSINAWFTAATNGRLKEIITADQITHDRLDFAVTSAVLFSGRWEHVFDVKQTIPAPFHGKGNTFDVSMMRHRNELGPYAEIDGVQALKRPYRSSLLSALFLLPQASPGALENLEASLSAEKLALYRAKLATSFVNVEIPRFEIGSDFALSRHSKPWEWFARSRRQPISRNWAVPCGSSRFFAKRRSSN